MNCKQGDLAVIVKSKAGNEGKIMSCLRLATKWEVDRENFDNSGPVWVTDRSLICDDGNFSYLTLDSQLRPLRDNDGEDEMIRIAGKPEKATQ